MVMLLYPKKCVEALCFTKNNKIIHTYLQGSIIISEDPNTFEILLVSFGNSQ